MSFFPIRGVEFKDLTDEGKDLYGGILAVVYGFTAG